MARVVMLVSLTKAEAKARKGVREKSRPGYPKRGPKALAPKANPASWSLLLSAP